MVTDIMEVLQNLPITTTEILIFVAIALFTGFVWRAVRKPANLPPGPRGLPLVGYLPFLSSKPNEDFARLSKEYGPVFSMTLGTRFVVVLNSYESIKEALVKQADNFAARMTLHHVDPKKWIPNIFMAEGEVFKDYKRFSLSTLRDFGVGKLSMEPRIKEEISFLLNAIEDYKGKPTDIGDLIRMSISNVICSIKLGHRFDYDNPHFQKLISILNKILQRSKPIALTQFVSWIFIIPGMLQLLGVNEFRDLMKNLMDIILAKVKDRKSKHVDGSEHDFIDAWLTEAKRRGEENGQNFTDEHLARVLFSLFIAGSDTTSNTIRWSLLFLMKHPEIQTKVQKEIDEIVGHERTPSLQDRDLMPYTEAVINEVQRIATLVPLAINHSNFEATTLCGYHIPKRSVIMPNLWAVHHDPENYPEPFEFKPERFLNADGKLIKAEKLIPFSQGKRQCLGEALAKAELFLYFSSLLQRFTFKKPEETELDFDYVFASVSMPNAYEVCAEVRQASTTQAMKTS